MGERIIKAGLWVLVWALLAGGAGGDARGQDAAEIIRDIDARQRKIQTLTAGFSQRKETSLAREPLLSSGVVRFKRPDRILFLYARPEPLELALEGKTLWIYSPGRAQAEKVSFSQSRRAARYLDPVTAIFQKTFSRLAEHYAVLYRGKEAGGLQRFRLEPKEEKDREILSRADLWIDKDSGAILRFEMTEANQDRLTLEFKDLQINPPLRDQDLTVRIPPSVRVQEQISP